LYLTIDWAIKYLDYLDVKHIASQLPIHADKSSACKIADPSNSQNIVTFPSTSDVYFGISSPIDKFEFGSLISLNIVVNNQSNQKISYGTCDIFFNFTVAIYDISGSLVKEVGNCMGSCRFNQYRGEILPGECFIDNAKDYDSGQFFERITIGTDPRSGIKGFTLPRGTFDIVLVPSDWSDCQAPPHKPDGPAFRITVE
jgi:hypothetical protein